jgi:hypothetical protein
MTLLNFHPDADDQPDVIHRLMDKRDRLTRAIKALRAIDALCDANMLAVVTDRTKDDLIKRIISVGEFGE